MGPQKELRATHLQPTVSYDVANVFIRNDGDQVYLNFIQVRREDSEAIYGDVVASLHVGGMQQAEELIKVISNTIEQHRNQEK